MKRHITRKHKEEPENDSASGVDSVSHQSEPAAAEVITVQEAPSFKTINEFLQALKLEQYQEIFEKEQIDLKILSQVKLCDIMDMVKEIGIIPWGHRYKIKQAIEELQEKVVPNETVEDLVETSIDHELTNKDHEVTDEDHEVTNVDHQITDVIQNQTFDTVSNSIVKTQPQLST